MFFILHSYEDYSYNNMNITIIINIMCCCSPHFCGLQFYFRVLNNNVYLIPYGIWMGLHSMNAHFIQCLREKTNKIKKKKGTITSYLHKNIQCKKGVKMNFKLPYASISISLITCLSPFITFTFTYYYHYYAE